RRGGATPFMTLLAAWSTLMSRLSGQDDVACGTPVANRTRAEIEGLIGFFVNTLVLRVDLAGDPPFAEALARVRETALAAYAHQDLPFEVLVSELQPDRDLARSPLFQVMFAVQNAPRQALALTGLDLIPLEPDSEPAKLDLMPTFDEGRSGRLQARLGYSADLFDRTTVERLLACFETLVEEAAAHPGSRLSGLALLGEAERHQILAEWGEGRPAAPAAEGVVERIAAWAERTPDAPA